MGHGAWGIGNFFPMPHAPFLMPKNSIPQVAWGFLLLCWVSFRTLAGKQATTQPTNLLNRAVLGSDLSPFGYSEPFAVNSKLILHLSSIYRGFWLKYKDMNFLFSKGKMLNTSRYNREIPFSKNKLTIF